MISEKDGSIFIDVKVIPRSSKNKIEFDGESLRIKITAPPVDGKANKAIVALLAKTLSVAKSAIVIVRGETGKNKLIRIDGISTIDLIAKLAK